MHHFDEIWHRCQESEIKEPSHWSKNQIGGFPIFTPFTPNWDALHFQWEH